MDFDCLDASNGQITSETKVEDMASLDVADMNPVFGPVFVRGAQPGDAASLRNYHFLGGR